MSNINAINPINIDDNSIYEHLHSLYQKDFQFTMTVKEIGEMLGLENPEAEMERVHTKYESRLCRFCIGEYSDCDDSLRYDIQGIMEICRHVDSPKVHEFNALVCEIVRGIMGINSHQWW